METMRRARQQLSESGCLHILDTANEGVLCLSSVDGWPYGVPLNFVYEEGKIFFHCAKEGKKIDLIRQNPKACLTVIDERTILPEQYSTAYSSIMAFGTCTEIDDPKQKAIILKKITDKFCADMPAERTDQVIQKSLEGVGIIEMNVERLTGKHSKYLNID